MERVFKIILNDTDNTCNTHDTYDAHDTSDTHDTGDTYSTCYTQDNRDTLEYEQILTKTNDYITVCQLLR